MCADDARTKLRLAKILFVATALIFSVKADAEDLTRKLTVDKHTAEPALKVTTESTNKLTIAECRSICEKADSSELNDVEQKRFQLCVGQKLCGVKPTIVPVYQKYDKEKNDDSLFKRIYEAVTGHMS